MMTALRPDQTEALDWMLDDVDLPDVIAALASACLDRSCNGRTDMRTADIWRRRYDTLRRLALSHTVQWED
jgi:hypothetical protein